MTFTLLLLQAVNYTILQLPEENILPHSAFSPSEPGSSSIPAASIRDLKTVCLFAHESFGLGELQWCFTGSHPRGSQIWVLVTVKVKQHSILETHFKECNETVYYLLP